MSVRLTYPALLLLWVVPFLLIAWVIYRRGRETAVPYDHAIPRSGSVLKFIINLAEALPPILLAVVIFILAGPQRLEEPTTRRKLTNIEFCVDISGSMTAPFGSGTRYDASMKAINEFLEFRQGDAFGLTFFGNNVLHWVPLTTDVSAFSCAPPFMRPELAPPWFGGTEIGKALLACKQVLTAREDGDRMIVLISDGFSSDLSNGNDTEIAKKLRASNITVFAVHIGSTEAPSEIVNLTSLTGGDVFTAGEQASLQAVFERIDSMQQTELEKNAAESVDYFEPFVLAGLVLTGLCCLALFGLRYTPW